MSYKKPVIPVLGPYEGFNRLKKFYSQYHKHLDSFDKGSFARMLPRSVNGLDLLDLGAGDGRMYKFFKNKDIGRFVAFDISPDLLSRHPGVKGVEKIIGDVEKTLSFEVDEFDLVLSFFLFEYVKELRDLFEEVYRVLKPGGAWIVGHFLHRREYAFKDARGEFKIVHHKWSFKQLEEFAERAFFDHSYMDVIEKGVVIGRIYRFEKN